MLSQVVATWKKNGLKLRILAETTGRFGEPRLLVQKITAQNLHGIFSIEPKELDIGWRRKCSI